MPRQGKGQKMQTATGQQYGQAQQQEEAQRVVPLPEMPSPRLSADPSQRPGAAAFARRSERPNESVTTRGGATQSVMSQAQSQQQRQRAMNMLLMLEPLASRPGADIKLQNTVRRLKRFVGNMADIVNENPEQLMKDAATLTEEP